MIEVLLETTGTVDGFTYQPHIYYVDKKSGKLVGFHPKGGEKKIFSKPMKFDKKYRKFKLIKTKESING
jgi:hypothetical protein